jgi:Fic family protein
MTPEKILNIWNPATGIEDIPHEYQSLAASEIPGIKAVWQDQRERLKGTSQLTDFTEKLSREWAIETGIIENLYEIERGVTQTLIERGFQTELLIHGSTNKPREHVLQLLRDQKDALDGVFDFVKKERPLSVSYIKELHAALLRSQATTEGVDAQGYSIEIPLIKGTWKTQNNFPVRDGITYQYCPPEHVASEMDRLIQMYEVHINNNIASEIQAAWLHHRFTQIHPFQDGNGRVARAIASLVLIKDGLFPLVVTRDDRTTYIDALEAADKNNIKPLVELFAKLQRTQFAKATAISESILTKDNSVDSMLDELSKAADKIAAHKTKELQKVFNLAKNLQDNLRDNMAALSPRIKSILVKLTPNADVYFTQSSNDNDYYYRSQIFEVAKKYLNYYVDPSAYRNWISLNIKWNHRNAQIVFSIHGIGRPFSGSLICAPFLELKDIDQDGQRYSTVIPVCNEGFVFFYNEKTDALIKRFNSWRDNTLQIAIKELIRNL